jgi:hypothetical protein
MTFIDSKFMPFNFVILTFAALSLPAAALARSEATHF